jgi:nucleotide-binding universal stress UspA family protein
MFRTILLPLDGSTMAEGALPHAEAMAEAFGASLRLLRVIPVRQRAGAAPLDIIDRRLDQAEADAYLDTLAADLRSRGRTVDTEVVEGHPADRIVESVRAQAVDLLVLTTHGSGGDSEFPISGTAHKVITRAGISVCLIPNSERAYGGRGTAPAHRRVLVGVDGSLRGEWALGPAAQFARHRGADLVLAHVVQIPEIVAEPEDPELHQTAETLVTLNRRAARRRLADAKGRYEGPDLKVRTRVELASPAVEALADIAEAEQADLMVLAAHGASVSMRRPYGAVALQALGEARCPLLIVQDAPRRFAPATTRRSERQTTLNHR